MLDMNRSLTKEIIQKIQIPDYGSIELSLENETIDCNDYFEMAVRKNNAKRNFLFVSKLLGKHIPIKPSVLFNSCRDLVAKYAYSKKLKKAKNRNFLCLDKTLVIGFAETATAMGHSVFDCFNGECNYVHTTRDRVANYEFAFEFEEEHCHAVEQLFFLKKKSWIENAKEIIIVDDEITTGKTVRNIISQIDRHYPNKKYSVITFLDWRNAESKNAYAELFSEKGIHVDFYSFVQGCIETISIADNILRNSLLELPHGYNPEANNWQFHYLNMPKDIVLTAGAGICIEEQNTIKNISKSVAQKLQPLLKGNRRAIIGTGEFMFVPMQIAQNLNGNNYCNATTRSPIIPNDKIGYGVQKAFQFICPYDTARVEYLYNSNTMECEEIVVIFEYEQPIKNIHSMLSVLDTAEYSCKHVVFLK